MEATRGIRYDRAVPSVRGLSYLLSRGQGNASLLPTVAARLERLRRRDRWLYSPRRFGASVDLVPLQSPIFILGLQGGGTTLVSRCLLRHPDVVSMGGNSDFWVATDELGYVRNRMARLPSSLWSSAHRVDLADPLFGTEHASVYACDALLPYYRRTAADATPPDALAFKRLLREHIAVYARNRTTARFVDKTHTYTIKIPYLDALLADCRPCYVLVLRNPYTHCFRAVRRKPPSWRRDVSYEDSLRIAAEHWENSLRIALEDGSQADRFVVVRFEDFVHDPAAAIRRICQTVSLSYSDQLVPQPEHRMPFGTLPHDRKWFPLHSDEWRSHIPEQQLAIIEERCGKLATQLGYERSGETEPKLEGIRAA
jgi:Sulfotransferase family